VNFFHCVYLLTSQSFSFQYFILCHLLTRVQDKTCLMNML